MCTWFLFNASPYSLDILSWYLLFIINILNKMDQIKCIYLYYSINVKDCTKLNGCTIECLSINVFRRILIQSKKIYFSVFRVASFFHKMSLFNEFNWLNWNDDDNNFKWKIAHVCCVQARRDVGKLIYQKRATTLMESSSVLLRQ